MLQTLILLWQNRHNKPRLFVSLRKSPQAIVSIPDGFFRRAKVAGEWVTEKLDQQSVYMWLCGRSDELLSEDEVKTRKEREKSKRSAIRWEFEDDYGNVVYYSDHAELKAAEAKVAKSPWLSADCKLPRVFEALEEPPRTKVLNNLTRFANDVVHGHTTDFLPEIFTVRGMRATAMLEAASAKEAYWWAVRGARYAVQGNDLPYKRDQFEAIFKQVCRVACIDGDTEYTRLVIPNPKRSTLNFVVKLELYFKVYSSFFIKELKIPLHYGDSCVNYLENFCKDVYNTPCLEKPDYFNLTLSEQTAQRLKMTPLECYLLAVAGTHYYARANEIDTQEFRWALAHLLVAAGFNGSLLYFRMLGELNHVVRNKA